MRKFKNHLIAAAIGAAGLATAGGAQAAVTYKFELIPELSSTPLFTLTYEAPDFITADVIVPFGNCQASNPEIVCKLEFRPNADPYLPGSGDDFDVVRFVRTNSFGDTIFTYAFANGAFLQEGVYIADGPENTQLTVGAPVPEPSAWALMILGFASVGAVARRRLATAS